MNKLRHYILLTLCCISLVSTAQIRFTINAPRTAIVGEPFRVSYEVNSTDVSSFSQPTFGDLECLNGPAVSQFASSSVQNGSYSSQQQTKYTYMLMAHQSGTFTLPAASVNINGKSYRSKSATIKVGGTNTKTNAQGSNSQELQPAGSSITNRDLFLTVTTNKRKVYEQEPVVLTYKVHARVGVGLRNVKPKKKAEFDGFLTQDVQLPSNIATTTATHNGVLYKEGVFRQYVIFPQSTGTLSIPTLSFDCEVLQQDMQINAMDAFFNGAGMLSVRVERTSPEVQLEVLPLPEPRPANFSGGVGKLSIKSELPTTQPTTHEPCTYRLILTGVGNMKLITAPKIEFPKDFESFEPKITDETQLTAEGIAGQITYDYTFVPNNEGEYVIPAAEFVYFDSETNDYKTIKSAPIKLEVKKGTHTAADWEKERRYRESDIADIQTQAGNWRNNGMPEFWGSAFYWGIYALLIVLFITIIKLLSKYMKHLSDVTGQKSKHARQVALKSLSEAASLISQTDGTAFYATVAAAINGYLADKFALTTSDISRENIATMLREMKYDESIIQKLKEVMETCEYAQFSPNSDVERHQLHQKAQQLIHDMEQFATPTKAKKALNVFLFILMTYCSLQMMAQTKEAGDSAYLKANYAEAVKHYEAALQHKPDATTYYNMGCAYYRLKQIPQAVLNFERAARLNPADENTRFNLEICRHRIVDRFNRAEEMFFVTYLKELIATRSAGQWGFMALLLFAGTLVLFGIYWLGKRVWLRKLTFFTALIAFLFCISFNIFAGIQHHATQSQTKAIVFTQDNVYNSSTDGAKALREINPGTTLIITDKKVKGWYGIILPDGTEGWVRSKSVVLV